jgi:hypothetical protein
MAAGQGVEEYIEISDFTPGLQSDYLSYATTAGPSNQDGFCQVNDTHGCFGGKFGGLHPAPRLVATKTQALFDSVTARYPTPGEKRAQIVATYLMSPVWPSTGTAALGGDLTAIAYSGEPDQVFVAYNWYYSDTGAAGTWMRKYRLESYRAFRSTPDQVTIQTLANSVTGLQVAFPQSQRRYGFGSIDGTRSNLTSATVPGPAHIVYSMADWTLNKVNGAWPGPSTLRSDTAANSLLGGTQYNQAVVSHQGRVIFIENQNNANWGAGVPNVLGQPFGSVGVVPAGESVGYSDPNAFIATNVNFNMQLFVEENPTGFGTWQSMNANELFLVKNRGGGVVIRGDVARPTVVRLPGLPSVYDATNKGALTDKGYVYGTRNGVYRWNGADTADDLAPQMGGSAGGWFWKTDDDETDLLWPGALHGTFAYAPPFVLTPNNFMYNTETNSWWRISPTTAQDPSGLAKVFAHWQTSTSGRFYGFPAYISDTQTTVYSRFDPNLGTNYYVWRSQPLSRTRNRTLNLREINLTAQGSGIVTIQLIGPAGVLVSKDFIINSTARPIIQFLPIKVQSQDVEIRILSAGDDDTINAPVVHRIAIGYNTASSVSH